MTAHDPMEKEMATEKKQEKINQAEWNKQEIRHQNAASRKPGSAGVTGMGTGPGMGTMGTGTGMGTMGTGPGMGTGTGTGTGPYTHSTTGATAGQPMGGHQMSALPGHGTGQPTGHGGHQTSALPGHGTGQPTGLGHVTEGVVGSHPIGTNTGTGGRTTADNTRVGGGDHPNTGYGTGGEYH